jgi:hypothetical protein
VHAGQRLECTVQLGAGAARVALSIALPPDYLSGGGAAECHATSAELPRSWADGCTAALRALAAAAAGSKSPCLFNLYQLVQDRLPAGGAPPQAGGQQQPPCDAAGTGRADAGVAPQLHAALLQLDHMRDRAGYTKTVKRWCTQLGLTGRLIFYR